MKQTTNETPAAREGQEIRATQNVQAAPQVAKIKDANAAMRQAIDDLLWVLISESSDEDIINALMLFLYEVSCQPSPTVNDCLDWAVTHCYQWTHAHNKARDAHIAGLLAERGKRAAQRADVAPGQERETQ